MQPADENDEMVDEWQGSNEGISFLQSQSQNQKNVSQNEVVEVKHKMNSPKQNVLTQFKKKLSGSCHSPVAECSKSKKAPKRALEREMGEGCSRKSAKKAKSNNSTKNSECQFEEIIDLQSSPLSNANVYEGVDMKSSLLIPDSGSPTSLVIADDDDDDYLETVHVGINGHPYTQKPLVSQFGRIERDQTPYTKTISEETPNRESMG